MISPYRPKRQVSNRLRLAPAVFLTFTTILCCPISAEPATALLKFLPTGTQATAISSPDRNLIVSVYNESSQLTKAAWLDSKNFRTLSFVGHDPITKLYFFENPSAALSKGIVWKKSFDGASTQNLTAITPNGPLPCTFDCWITEIHKKVLPLSLLSVSFSGTVPGPGTPLLDSSSQIIGILFKQSSGNSAYVIPTQAVHRVQQDISRHRKFVRGYLGLSLSTESSVPRIQRVLPDSPAAKAGLMESDILVKAGSFPIERYPDAVNAFFYAVPGEVTTFEVLRNSKRLPCKITPTAK
ncbi:S1C family serine protease [Luteolibacter sp. AS25]|uniref:S1C family serine protease n=1 Tax=Luteolibacter sp. AS25 TaxID=3135776 RepID=UPI00398B408D